MQPLQVHRLGREHGGVGQAAVLLVFFGAQGRHGHDDQ